jgi:transposase IS4-like protein/DDE family transposase
LRSYLATCAPPDATGWADHLAARLPLELLDEAISAAGCQDKRRRLLPARAVMVFVLGCCLFAGEGYTEVARKMAAQLERAAGRPRWRLPGAPALAQARARLGAGPFEVLFGQLASPLATVASPGASAFGRTVLLLAADGTMLDVPASRENIAAFGPPPSGRSQGGYPQVRLVTLAACGTRALAGAASGPRKGRGSSEQALAVQIARQGRLGRGMLVTADRNFSGYKVITAFTATGADVLIRVKSSARLPVMRALPDGSYLSVLADPRASRLRTVRNGQRRRRGSRLPPDTAPVAGTAVRVIEAVITAQPAGGQPSATSYRLITTLTDPGTAPAAQIAALYAQRWEAETGYRELKTFLRGTGRILRSRHPDGVKQEIYALLCAHQLIQATRASAAATAGHDPDRISYTVTLRAIRRHLTRTHPHHSPRAAISEILTQLLPPTRRQRSYPRATSTARRRTLRTNHTGHITYTITITPPPTPP